MHPQIPQSQLARPLLQIFQDWGHRLPSLIRMEGQLCFKNFICGNTCNTTSAQVMVLWSGSCHTFFFDKPLDLLERLLCMRPEFILNDGRHSNRLHFGNETRKNQEPWVNDALQLLSPSSQYSMRKQRVKLPPLWKCGQPRIVNKGPRYRVNLVGTR